jgi:hypothetical protein
MDDDDGDDYDSEEVREWRKDEVVFSRCVGNVRISFL